MKVNLVFIVLLFVVFIDYSLARRYDHPAYYGQSDGVISSGRSRPGRARALNIGETVGKGVGFITRKAKQVVKLIRCVLQCFIKYFISNYCNRMFPCLYDCSIGQTYIAPEVEKQIKEAKTSYPAGITLNHVFKVFRCLYDCAMERPIKNWETFAAALYCVADTCICFNIFGAAMGEI